MNNILLLPQPRQISWSGGEWRLPRGGVISIDSPDPALVSAAKGLEKLLGMRVGGWRCTQAAPRAGVQAIRLESGVAVAHEQGYTIEVRPQGVLARARNSRGLFYAVQTLRQLAQCCRCSWPCMTIADQPDFARRGFYHDISRGKVPKVQTILWLVDQLAQLKINEFQLYVENVFAFQRHPDFAQDTTPLTAAEIRRIDAACRLRHIDFVPSLASLGHFEKILRLPRYRHLAEADPADLKRRGVTCGTDDPSYGDSPWTLCVTDPEAKKLLAEMYDEFLPNFSSPQFNICCDEVYDLGLGRSQAAARRQGVGRLYVDWIRYCAELAARHGKRVQLWGDMMLKYPALIRDLPVDATVLEWGYGAKHPFREHGQLFAASGRAFYVCPGTSSWSSLAGRTANAFANMRNGALAGLRHGAVGYLNTDWGDFGHQQLLAVSLLPMAFGAAVSWNHRLASDRAILKAASVQVFGDPTGKIAQLVADVGNVYRRINREKPPESPLDFQLFREPWCQTTYLENARLDYLATEIRRLSRHLAGLKRVRSTTQSQALILQELNFTIRLIQHTLRRTMLRARHRSAPGVSPSEIVALLADIRALRREFKTLWRKRNKESRLADIEAHFVRLEGEYRRVGSAYTTAPKQGDMPLKKKAEDGR